ncbi:MAG: flagellar filament capping protein FliD [Planctomycetes bacterium]|nr:flagellar filament capping protein FliD [Planctomycetota bacterium]
MVDVQCLSSTGLGGSLSQTMDELTDVVDGYFTSANSDVEENIAALKEQMEKMEERLNKKEESLYRKFNAMESALSQLQSQSDTLTTLFSSLNSSSD